MMRAEGAPLSEVGGVELQGVGKVYGSGAIAVHALKHVDLAIEPGQFVVILGPSGSGKTTFLNLVGGIEEPSEGSLRVAGRDLTSLSRAELTRYRREHVGFVFQFFNLVPTLTALENVQLVGELAGEGEGSAAAGAAGGRGGRRARGGRRPPPPPPSRASPRSCPAGSSSAWRSLAPSSSSRGSCSATSRPGLSTSTRAGRCSPSCIGRVAATGAR